MAVLKKVTLYYPCFLKENKKSNKFQVNIGGLTPAHVKILTDELGIDDSQIKEPKQFTKKDDPEGTKQETADAQGTYVIARSKFRAVVKNGKREIVGEDTIKRIGNGSIANVQVNGYDWTFDGKSGVSAGLQQVQLLKREDYVGFADEFSDEEDELDSEQSFKDELDELETDID